MDVIGMTNLQEAKLAREAEICYVTVAMVTDYDCWHPDHDAVTVTDIIANLMKNAEHAAKCDGGRRQHAGRAHLQVRLGARARADHRPRAGARSHTKEAGSDRWQISRLTQSPGSYWTSACKAPTGRRSYSPF